MGEQLRIEGKEAVALAAELAALTGESVETAVTSAMRRQIARAQEKEQRRARIRQAPGWLGASLDNWSDQPLRTDAAELLSRLRTDVTPALH